MIRFLKLALISAVALFGIIWLISMLLPSQVRVSRAIDINAAASSIRPLLNDPGRWDQWNEYIHAFHHRLAAADMLKTDEMAIFITADKPNLVKASWQQPSGKKFGSGYAIVESNNAGAHTTVQWYFDFQLRWYPWEKFQSIVYDAQLGPIMEKSLQHLKQIAEKSD